MTDERQDELPIVPSRKSKWGAWEYGLLSAGIIAAGIAISGTIYCHSTNKNSAIKKATAPLITKVDDLKKRNTALDSTLKTEVAALKTEHEEETKRILEETKKEITSLEGKVRSVYEDSLRNSYQTNFSKHPAEIRNFAYKFERGEEGRVYLDIKPVSEKTLKEVVEVVIPENYRERKELALAIPGFFDRYSSLARKNGLSDRLTDYASIDATPQSNGVWNLTFVTRDGKEKGVKYYPGRD